MAALRRLLYAALCAGLLSGVVAAAAHQIATVPLILKAEGFEQAGRHADGAQDGARESRVERALYTLATDLLTAVGFALLLAAGITLRGGEAGWRDGLLWGLAGFAAFTLAPSLGLPPDLPGSAAGPLAARQLWWLATAAATSGGLALLAFTRRPAWAVLATALIVLPHLYGAPQPGADALAGVPAALARRFAVAVIVARFLFWVVLGASTGYFLQFFGRRSRITSVTA